MTTLRVVIILILINPFSFISLLLNVFFDFFLGEEDVTLVLGYGINMEFVLCHLSKSHRQECMELKFSPGENIYFFSLGPYPMKISG